jgi:hypothetical protein
MSIPNQPNLLNILSQPLPKAPSPPKPEKNIKLNKLALGGLHDEKFQEKEEIRKWIEARKKRFPSRFNTKKDKPIEEEKISILERKLRTKLMILKDDNPHERAEKRRQKRYW